jgi:CRISPR/Cas system CSM-associated protein Csm2 small subunit
MAEPFSVAAAGIALVANLRSLYDYLKEVKEGIGSVHNDIDALQIELESLQDLCKSVKQLLDEHQERSSLDAEQGKRWDGLSKPLSLMDAAIKDFDIKLRKVYGEDPKRRAWRESIKKWNRFKEVEPDLNRLRSTIASSRGKIVVWMQSIGINKLFVSARFAWYTAYTDAGTGIPPTKIL